MIPLRVGSGTRMKAYEAMALGRPVVATSIGMEGLDVTPGRHFLLADDAANFAAAILRLLDDAELRRDIATEARQRVEDRFSWRQIAKEFEAICWNTYSAGRRSQTETSGTAATA